MTRDLGTYHLRVILEDGKGWIQTYYTGCRYTHGTDDGRHETTKLDADPIRPTWNNEEELFETMVYMYTIGNYSCDCNKKLFYARAHQLEDPEGEQCGKTMPVKSLTAIRPDRTEVVLFVDGKEVWKA